MSSFWRDYRDEYGDAALPPAGRKALGLPPADALTNDAPQNPGADLAPPATGEEAPATNLPRRRRQTLRITLDEAHRRMLADVSAEAGTSDAETAQSIISHVLDDDASAHGR
ncbi:hypothetical protein C8N35_10296 [Breoghania corrubedonensis]|uniref:Uncharacterized protein n=1 Tax=Breoghania corrubedonensis TaxID=665038 RepID=A0A2T5VCB3_9HYPH|nr:hypothetical protein [Breoghania corrubedonensis]PTW61387.1 hypothetical protein C8N35_10296 [Breoghania corrubedonensis]